MGEFARHRVGRRSIFSRGHPTGEGLPASHFHHVGTFDGEYHVDSLRQRPKEEHCCIQQGCHACFGNDRVEQPTSAHSTQNAAPTPKCHTPARGGSPEYVMGILMARPYLPSSDHTHRPTLM